MPTPIATLFCWAFILALFALDFRRQKGAITANWIPAIYFFILATRPVSAWLESGSDSAGSLEDGSPVDRAFFIILQLLAAGVLAQRTARLRPLLLKSFPIVLFFSYCLISIVWSDYPTVALKRWIKLLEDLMMVMIPLTDREPLLALRRVLLWPAFVSIPLSVLFIKYIPALGRGYDPWGQGVYMHGASYNKNGLGALCLFSGVALAWTLSTLKSRDEWRPLTAGPLIVLFLANCWLLKMSQSATSTVCLIAACLLIGVVQIRWIRMRPFVLHLGVLSFLAIPALVLFGGTGKGALDALGRDSTLTGRTELWAELFPLVQNPILGAGYESFWLGDRLRYLWSIYWWRPTQSHNGFIELYLNLGIAGLALFAAVLFSGYWKSLREIQRGNLYQCLGLTSVVISIPYNYTEATYRIQNLPLLFVFLAVLGIPASRSAAFRRKAKSRDASRGVVSSQFQTAGIGPISENLPLSSR